MGISNRVNSSFSSKLLKHGHWVDNSLYAATRLKKRMIMMEYKRNFSIDRINQNFSEEADNLLKLQQLLAIRQKRMAYTVIEKYSALSIQLCYRCYISRKRLYIRKILRFLNDWLWGVYHRHKRQRARYRIYTAVLYWHRHRCFKMMLLKVRKARQIQANVRRALTSHRFRQYRDYMRYVRTIVNHISLFASTRAMKHIIYERDKRMEECKRIIRNVVIKYRCRKRRNILKGPYGKFIFYFLEQRSMQCILTDMKAKPLVDKSAIRHLSVADVAKAILAAKIRKEAEEEEIARDIILYLKHKVEEKTAKKGDNNNTVIDKTKILVSTRRRMSQRKVSKPIVVVQSLGKPIELPNGLSVQLPASWPSLFRMSSMYEAACMIIDLLGVAVNNQSLIDDEIPQQILEMNTPKPPSNAKRRNTTIQQGRQSIRPSREATSKRSNEATKGLEPLLESSPLVDNKGSGSSNITSIALKENSHLVSTRTSTNRSNSNSSNNPISTNNNSSSTHNSSSSRPINPKPSQRFKRTVI